MIEAGEVTLVLPKQSVDEFARNKDRIIRDSRKNYGDSALNSKLWELR
jgi:hypothetical protein